MRSQEQKAASLSASIVPQEPTMQMMSAAKRENMCSRREQASKTCNYVLSTLYQFYILAFFYCVVIALPSQKMFLKARKKWKLRQEPNPYSPVHNGATLTFELVDYSLTHPNNNGKIQLLGEYFSSSKGYWLLLNVRKSSEETSAGFLAAIQTIKKSYLGSDMR